MVVIVFLCNKRRTKSVIINHKVLINQRLEPTRAADVDCEEDEEFFDISSKRKSLVVTQRESNNNEQRVEPPRSGKDVSWYRRI